MKKNLLAVLYFFITALFIFGIIIACSDYTYPGYFTGKIINWIWLVLTLAVIILYWKRRIVKIYFFLLMTLIILSILPMGIPFFAFVNYFTTNQDYQQLKINDKYRLVRTNHQALSMVRIYVYEKQGLLEKNIYRTPYNEILDSIIKADHYVYIDERNTPIQNVRFISANDDSLGIEYRILNKKTIFYHKSGDDGY